MIQYKVICSLLRIRTQPTVNSKCVGFYESGEMIYTGGEPFQGDDGRLWIRYFGRKTGVSRYVCYHENNGGQFLIQIKSQSNSLNSYKNAQYPIENQKIGNKENLISSEKKQYLNVDDKNQKEEKMHKKEYMEIEEIFKFEKNDIKNFENPNKLKEFKAFLPPFHINQDYQDEMDSLCLFNNNSISDHYEINKMISFNEHFQQSNILNPTPLVPNESNGNFNFQLNDMINPISLITSQSNENFIYQQNIMRNPISLISNQNTINFNYQQSNILNSISSNESNKNFNLQKSDMFNSLLGKKSIGNINFFQAQYQSKSLNVNRNGLMKEIRFECCFLNSRAKHDKFFFDNMMKKVKSLSIDIIIDILNIKLNKNNELKKHFVQIKILKIKPDTNNPTKKYYLNLLNRTFRQILSSQVSKRYHNKNDYNKKIIDKIYEIYQKENSEIIKDLIDFLNMKFLQFWEGVKEYFIRRDRKLISINEETNHQFLSSLIEEFIPKVDEYLTKKNENEMYKIKLYEILEDIPSKIKNMKGEVKKK